MASKFNVFLLTALCAGPLLAADIKVENPWARATAPGQPAGGAFMDLTADTDMTLVSARSPVAKVVQLHSMTMDNGVMIMRQMEKIDLPKGKTVSLKPGGLHIMLIGLNTPLRENQLTSITLLARDATGKTLEIPVTVPVKGMGGMSHTHHH